MVDLNGSGFYWDGHAWQKDGDNIRYLDVDNIGQPIVVLNNN